MNIIYESLPTFPPLAASIITVCIYIMLAGLALWLAANAGMRFVEMVLEAIEADKALAQLQRQADADTLNFWIRENFRNKRMAAEVHEADQKALAAETKRADQEAYNKRQLLKGKAYMEGGKA